VKINNVQFMVTYAYDGYPMVIEAKHIENQRLKATGIRLYLQTLQDLMKGKAKLLTL